MRGPNYFNERRLRKAQIRQKIKQNPLRFFIVEPLTAVGRIALDGLTAFGGFLFDFLIKIVVVALGFGLVFLTYTLFTANIIISIVAVGLVVIILLITALLYW